MITEDMKFCVLVHNKPVKEYNDEDGNVFIEGRGGTDYKIRAKNLSGKRRLVVITVDGLSIMDGKPGGFDSRGYIVEPFGKIDIPGFSLDNNEVAKFTFGSVGSSYAASKGKKSKKNVGVIGCAVFDSVEKPPTITVTPAIYYNSGPYKSCPDWTVTTTSTIGDGVYGSNVTNCSTTSGGIRGMGGRKRKSMSKGVGQNIGTSFGKREVFETIGVTFERKEAPTYVFSMNYDDRKGLKDRGIDMRPKPLAQSPNPFPANNTGCAPPKNWKG